MARHEINLGGEWYIRQGKKTPDGCRVAWGRVALRAVQGISGHYTGCATSEDDISANNLNLRMEDQEPLVTGSWRTPGNHFGGFVCLQVVTADFLVGRCLYETDDGIEGGVFVMDRKLD